MQKLTKDNCLGTMYPELAKEWHPTKNGDLTPFDVAGSSHKIFWWLCKNGHEFKEKTHNRNRTKISNFCLQCNSVAFLQPHLLVEWNYEKNKGMNPEFISIFSAKKAWWICQEGHEWEDKVCKRGLGWGGCKVCNSLGFLFPDIAREWHPTKNGKLTSFDVAYASGKKVWWLCEKGHKWETTVLCRTSFNKRHTKRGRYCPYCTHQKVYKDISLEFLNLKLAREWHPTKNGKLTPKNVTANSTRKVWWKCEICNSEWEDTVAGRSRSKSCPFCNGKRVNETNSLASLNLELDKEWHPTKNGDLTPHNVTYKSGKKVWWQCLVCGSEWKAMVCERSIGHAKCLKCRSLGTLCPHLMDEWDFVKNVNIDPFLISSCNDTKVWWICKRGHEFEMIIGNRTTQNQKCPYCQNKRACHNNCLGTLNPELSKEWHPTKNGKLTPNDVTFGSGKKIWWRCFLCGNEWKATVVSRSDGHGCPKRHSIILKDGTHCASYVEAYTYLGYKKDKLKFEYDKRYSGLGRNRYDFYFPKENKYVEVTSFNKNFHYKHGHYFSYLRKIVKKKRHVENVLKAKFEFIQFQLSGKQLIYTKQNIQKNPHAKCK